MRSIKNPMPWHAPATSRGSKKKDDAACNRRPARHDTKGLLFDMAERGEPDMKWCEGHRYDKHPKEYSRKNEGCSKIFLTNTFVIS
jgi:hypothetical protein